MDAITKEMFGKKIWILVDETTVVECRYIANIIIGILNIDEPGRIFLIFFDLLETLRYVRFSIKFFLQYGLMEFNTPMYFCF